MKKFVVLIPFLFGCESHKISLVQCGYGTCVKHAKFKNKEDCERYNEIFDFYCETKNNYKKCVITHSNNWLTRYCK